MRTQQEIDKDMLDATKGLTEALFRRGHLNDREGLEAQERRQEAGAKPLKLQRDTFDVSAIMATPYMEPDHIREIREMVGASQYVFACHLGVVPATISQWERGTRKPDGPARRMLYLIERKGLDYVSLQETAAGFVAETLATTAADN